MDFFRDDFEGDQLETLYNELMISLRLNFNPVEAVFLAGVRELCDETLQKICKEFLNVGDFVAAVRERGWEWIANALEITESHLLPVVVRTYNLLNSKSADMLEIEAIVA
jgi:hypothetical protein